MKKYKYAVIKKNVINLMNELDYSPLTDEVIENPTLKITKGILVISGMLKDVRFYSDYSDDIKLEMVATRYLRNTLFGNKTIKKGWVELKKKIPTKITMSQFTIVE